MDTHEQIIERMKDPREQEAVDLAAKMIRKIAGERFYILLPYDKEIAEDKTKIELFSDLGDIILLEKKSLILSLVEVKRLTLNNYMAHFQDRNTWTLPDFILDGTYQFNRKKLKVYMYMCFNAHLTWVTVIYPEKTFQEWTIDTKNGNGGRKDYYVVNPDLMKFIEVKTILENK